MDKILKIEKLTIGYGDNIILKNIDLETAEGEFLSIIGPNGTGKSTLIKAVTDAVDIKDGKIIICGRESSTISKRDRARLVAVVPQEFNIDFEFSVSDIVAMGRNPHYNRKVSKQHELDIIQDAMRLTNTWMLRDRLFNELSGGEKQRVIIARAIAQQTKIILLDEPTSHLDIHQQLEVLELVKKLQKEKKITIVAVLHDINMAARFSDRLLLLNQGEVLAEGSADEVIREKYLGKMYRMEMVIRDNKLLSSKEVVPIRVMKENCSLENIKVHVICGGGSGEKILERLNSLGSQVTCGVLNRGDSDFEICRMLGISCIEIPPFSNAGEKELQENIKLAGIADVILVSDVPYGKGNIKNLELLLETNTQIFMKKRHGQIDFTGGTADSMLEVLEEKKTFKFIESYEEFIGIICKGV